MEEIYKKIITEGYYDESRGMRPEMIDGKLHGVCIDFSRELIKEMREKGYEAVLIATLNDDAEKSMHAAVLYKDPETGEVWVADPVTDIKTLNAAPFTILDPDHSKISLRAYYEAMGPIRIFDDSEYENTGSGVPRMTAIDLQNKNEILARSGFTKLVKNVEHIQRIVSLEDVERVADTSSLLACQLLYEKGINTFCSNYDEETGYVDIAINYNSLSDENKEVLRALMSIYPENFFLYDSRNVFGYPSLNEASATMILDDSIPMCICIGFQDTRGLTPKECNLKMAELVSGFKKQEYREGVYTREQLLDNYNNRMKVTMVNKEPEPCRITPRMTRKRMAKETGLIYSKVYDMFFEDEIAMSRYIESLYRKENDWRSREEIARDAGIPYKDGLFTDKRRINIAEVATASRDYGINQTAIERARNFFEKILDRGER